MITPTVFSNSCGLSKLELSDTSPLAPIRADVDQTAGMVSRYGSIGLMYGDAVLGIAAIAHCRSIDGEN